MCVCMYVCMYVRMYVSMYVCMYVIMCIFIRTYMCLCKHVCIQITYIHCMCVRRNVSTYCVREFMNVCMKYFFIFSIRFVNIDVSCITDKVSAIPFQYWWLYCQYLRKSIGRAIANIFLTKSIFTFCQYFFFIILVLIGCCHSL